jgi:uncharacterized protein YukE
MTDVSLSVTQNRVEQFAKTYLEISGCTVQARDNEFDVSVPKTTTTELFDAGELNLVCSSDPERIGEAKALHPESETFQKLLQEAADRAPVGRFELMDAETEIRLPDWLVESEVSVVSTQFVPYYDRTAVVGLFRIGIETVSEYQTTILRTAAVDANSMEQLPTLSEKLLARTTPDSVPIEATTTALDTTTIREAIDTLSDHLIDQVDPTITEIQEGATRAAGSELNEYQELQDQRIQELEDKITSISDKVEKLSKRIDDVEDQAERLETLQERKELNSERDELQKELAQLTDARAAGFPTKRTEISNRHSLEVVIEPLTLTEFQYEQGELEVTIVDSSTETSVRVGYGNGVGVTEPLTCDRCESTLSGENPLRIDDGMICCTSCKK